MGGKQSLHERNIKDVLTFFEEETKKWNENIKNFKKSWEKEDGKSWVPEVLSREMEETETRWINIRSMIQLEKDRIKYTENAANLPSCCQEITRRIQSELKQMTQNNKTVLKNLQEAERKINEQTKIIEKLQLKVSTSDDGDGKIKEVGTPQSESEFLQQSSKHNEDSVRLAKGKNKECKHLEKDVETHKEREEKQKWKKGGEDQELVKHLQKQIDDMQKKFLQEKRKLIEENDLMRATTLSLESELDEKKKENESLLSRLSKVASERLLKDNTAITDLSDPNRPMKIGEVYSELYDNQWTDALEALQKAGHEERIAIETLTLTLQHVLEFCKTKAELLLKKSSDVNLLFEDNGIPDDEPKIQSHATMQPKQAKKVARIIRQKSTMEEIKFQHERWMAKTKVTPENLQQSTGQVGKGDESKFDVDSKFKQLRKEMATYMVPVVQKAYMEVNWSNRYIEALKPFICECIFISWMMIVQSPPMALHTCKNGTKFDKNFYKEYVTIGPLVKYMVWPALILNEDGPLICKGIAEGEKVLK